MNTSVQLFPSALLAMLTLGLLTACGTTPTGERGLTRARFFLESSDDTSAAVTLPQSEVRIVVAPKPVFTEFDVVDVKIAEVELGRCLMFQLTPAAARDLYRLSASHQGRRLVLTIDGVALGARRIDRPIQDGVIMVFVELPDSALTPLASEMNRTAMEVQREAGRKS